MHKFVKMMGANLLVAAIAALPFVAVATTYYASPTGTGTGSEADPCSLTNGITKVRYTSNTLVLKSGRYFLNRAIAFNGTSSGNPTEVRGETGNPEDVVLDAQGKSEVMRLNRNVVVSGITMMNGSNKGFMTDPGNRASGVRISYTPDENSKNTSCVVSNCVITCCTNEFTSTTEVCGGAVAVFENGLLVDSVVTNNTAVYRGGGVVMLKKGVVRNCQIVDNSAEDCGGGLFVERNATDALVADSLISHNVSSNGAGVANSTLTSTSLTLTNCTFRGNSAAIGWGGGLYLSNTNNITTTQCLDCRFEQNVAMGGGGACVNGRAIGRFNGCVFDGNTATTASDTTGGGACLVYGQYPNDGIASFTNCVFRNNISEGRGGAYCGG